MTDFSEYIKEKNAYMYFSFPSLNQNSFYKYTDAIDLLYSHILLNDFEVIGKPFDYSTPDSLHYDSSYHLTKKGQYFRTNKLINDLKKHGLQQRLEN